MWSERVMVLLYEGHGLSSKDRIYWPDLRQERFILPRCDPGPDLANMIRARLHEPGFSPDINVQDVTRDNVANMAPIGRFISLTTDAALGRTLPGVVLREVFEVTGGVAHIDYAGYWRSDNLSPIFTQFLKLVDERYPA